MLPALLHPHPCPGNAQGEPVLPQSQENPHCQVPTGHTWHKTETSSLPDRFDVDVCRTNTHRVRSNTPALRLRFRSSTLQLPCTQHPHKNKNKKEVPQSGRCQVKHTARAPQPSSNSYTKQLACKAAPNSDNPAACTFVSKACKQAPGTRNAAVPKAGTRKNPLTRISELRLQACSPKGGKPLSNLDRSGPCNQARTQTARTTCKDAHK